MVLVDISLFRRAGAGVSSTRATLVAWLDSDIGREWQQERDRLYNADEADELDDKPLR